MISILILTKNEEQNLPHCLASVRWSDDVHVFDSFSEDHTVAIAKEAGTTITQRVFDDYSSQRNAALNTVKFRYPWILILDADERVPDSLACELKKCVQNAPETVNGFRLRRKDYLGNTWLKHAQISPFYIRLIRAGSGIYHREINEVLRVNGIVQDIDGYFDHYPFSKGLTNWINKHNRYSSMEAAQWISEYIDKKNFSLKKALFSTDFTEKRYHQKGIFYKLPCRPIIKWFYMVLIRRAFLDGVAGITYATLQSIYEYFIVLKSRELPKQKITD